MRRKTKTKHAFAKNMQTDVRRSKIQLSKIIKSGGFLGKTLGNMIGNLSKKALLGLAVPLKKDVLPKLAIKTTLSVLNKFEKKKKKKKLVMELKEKEKSSLYSFQMNIWRILLISQRY